MLSNECAPICPQLRLLCLTGRLRLVELDFSEGPVLRSLIALLQGMPPGLDPLALYSTRMVQRGPGLLPRCVREGYRLIIIDRVFIAQPGHRPDHKASRRRILLPGNYNQALLPRVDHHLLLEHILLC